MQRRKCALLPLTINDHDLATRRVGAVGSGTRVDSRDEGVDVPVVCRRTAESGDNAERMDGGMEDMGGLLSHDPN